MKHTGLRNYRTVFNGFVVCAWLIFYNRNCIATNALMIKIERAANSLYYHYHVPCNYVIRHNYVKQVNYKCSKYFVKHTEFFLHNHAVAAFLSMHPR